MTKLLHPTLQGLFRIGLFDFYTLLAIGVCTIVKVPDQVLIILWSLLAIIFIVSAMVTLSGICLAKLYREFEAISIFILQAGLATFMLVAIV